MFVLLFWEQQQVNDDLFVWIVLSLIFLCLVDIEKDLKEIIKVEKNEKLQTMQGR